MTRNQRASVLGLAFASLAVLPAPGGVMGTGKRQMLAYSYALTPDVLPPDTLRAANVSLARSRGTGAAMTRSRAANVTLEP